MTINTSALAIAAGVAVCAGVGLLIASADNNDTSVAATNQGMIAVIDSESGQLRAPTADEASVYATSTRSTAKESAVVRRADGSESMRLNGAYQTYSTVARDENGNWVQHCSMAHDHAMHASLAPAAPQREVR
jgi:hypothetical protein